MTGPLNGLKVIDFGQYFAGPAIAMLLSDAGADVVRVDPPGGPVWKSDANAILQRGKRSIVLDLKTEVDRETASQLITSADIVIEGFRPGVMDKLGLGAQAMTAQNSRLIYCSLPGFASDDPRAHIPGYEGVVSSAVGIYAHSSWAEPDSPPVYNAIPLSSSFASILAGQAIAAALIARERTGHGQSIEVPLFDATFELMGQYAEKREGAPPPVDVSKSRLPITYHYECADGKFVHLSWLEERQLPRFLESFVPDAAAVEGISDIKNIRANPELAEKLHNFLLPLFKTRTAAEWDRIANPDSDLAECQTTEEWLTKDQHATDSGAVISINDPALGETRMTGYPITMKGTPLQAKGPRHALDSDRESILGELKTVTPASTNGASNGQLQGKALEGIRVVDVTMVLAGPTAARILAEYGADVIRVENPMRGGTNYHPHTNSGKKTILLDLKKPEGKEILHRLIAKANAISTNFNDTGARVLGASYDELHKINPSLVYSVISGFGLDGWRKENKGHEQVGQAVTGMQERWGRDFREPVMARWLVNDYGTGNFAALAIMLALYHQARTGEGQMVGASLSQSSTYHQIPYMLSYAGKDWSNEVSGQQAKGEGPLYRIYEASDRWFFLASCGAGDLQRLARVDGLQGVDAVDQAKLIDWLSERFKGQTAARWVEKLTAAGLGAHTVMNHYTETMEDPWVKAHGLSVTRTFEGVGQIQTTGTAARLSATPIKASPPAPPPGWHVREVIAEADMTDRWDELLEKNVVRDPTATAPRPTQPVAP